MKATKYTISRAVTIDGFTTAIAIVRVDEVETGRDPNDELGSGRYVAEVLTFDETGRDEIAEYLRQVADIIQCGRLEPGESEEL